MSKARRVVIVDSPKPRRDNKLYGKIDKMYCRSVIAEKMAERAFNLASSANLGVVALQKSLVVPRIITKPVAQQNQLAKDQVNGLFSKQADGSGFDWLRPILSDEELDILDKVEEHNKKFSNMKETPT